MRSMIVETSGRKGYKNERISEKNNEDNNNNNETQRWKRSMRLNCHKVKLENNSSRACVKCSTRLASTCDSEERTGEDRL